MAPGPEALLIQKFSQDYVLSVALTPDGRWVLSGSKDRGVQFWDPNTGTAQLMLRGHKNSGKTTSFLPPSQILRRNDVGMMRF
jgi:WD40 repeat protein